MSRAMQLAMSEQQASDLCAKEKVGVSTIEALPGGGVRLVCNSSTGAEIVRAKAGSKIMRIEGAREKHRPATPLW
jgi:hypothetical protein